MSCVRDREGVYNIVERNFFFFAFSSLSFIPFSPSARCGAGRSTGKNRWANLHFWRIENFRPSYLDYACLPTCYLPTYSIYRTVQHGTVPTSSRQAGRQAGNTRKIYYRGGGNIFYGTRERRGKVSKSFLSPPPPPSSFFFFLSKGGYNDLVRCENLVAVINRDDDAHLKPRNYHFHRGHFGLFFFLSTPGLTLWCIEAQYDSTRV